MKAFSILILSFVLRLSAFSQVQELEQLKLDLEKLAQFKMILSQMKQGYQALESGYNNVRDATKGNFNLHKNYLDGLIQVSEAVRQSPLLKEIARDQRLADGMFNDAWRQFQSSGLFGAAELVSFRNGYGEFVGRMNDDMEMLSLVVSSGSLRMSDAERLQVIGVIQGAVSGQLVSFQRMVGDYSKVLAMRKQQRADFVKVRALNGIR